MDKKESSLLKPAAALLAGVFLLSAGNAAAKDSKLETAKENVSVTASSGFENFVIPPPEKAGPDYKWKQEADEAAWKTSLAMRNTERGRMAAKDAAFLGEDYLKEIGRILNTEVSEKKTPALYALLSHSFKAAHKAVNNVKSKYKRPRPFVLHPEDETCSPEIKKRLNAHASYPSGHTIFAWTVGLTAASAVPGKAEAILSRSYEMGESRWICGHHWASDVQAGRELASATVAVLLSDPEYLRLLKAAREEMAEIIK